MRSVEDLAETLYKQYITLRQQDISGYRLSRSKNIHKFEELAEYLIDAHIRNPGRYMKFAVDLYSPNPYPNMVCSEKTVKRFSESRKNEITQLDPEYEKYIIEKRMSHLDVDMEEALEQLGGQISDLTRFCILQNNDKQLKAINYYSGACDTWLLLDEETKEKYKRLFPTKIIRVL